MTWYLVAQVGHFGHDDRIPGSSLFAAASLADGLVMGLGADLGGLSGV